MIYSSGLDGDSAVAAPLGVEISIDMPVAVMPSTRWLTINSGLTVAVSVTNNNEITGRSCALWGYEMNLQEKADTPSFSFVSPSVISGPATTAVFTLTAPSFVTTTSFYAYVTAYYTCTEGSLWLSQRGDSEIVMVWNEIHHLYCPLVTRN
jgi:hypothetical protein